MSSPNDNATTIKELRDLVAEFVHERDWEQFHTPKSLSIAISIEAAELLESFLFRAEEVLPDDITKFEHFTDEMADVFIYLMSLTNTIGLENFTEAVYRKMEKNCRKYPIESFSGINYQKQ